MLRFEEKIAYLKEQLENIENNYADSFKTDINILLGDFKIINPNLSFLHDLESKAEITSWIAKLTSRIVLKFDEDSESLNDFIYDYIELG